MDQRITIDRVDGQSLNGGVSVVLAYRFGQQVELVVTEEHGGEASVLLTHAQAEQLATAILASLDRG
jgi:hypothetical protein